MGGETKFPPKSSNLGKDCAFCAEGNKKCTSKTWHKTGIWLQLKIAKVCSGLPEKFGPPQKPPKLKPPWRSWNPPKHKVGDLYIWGGFFANVTQRHRRRRTSEAGRVRWPSRCGPGREALDQPCRWSWQTMVCIRSGGCNDSCLWIGKV